MKIEEIVKFWQNKKNGQKLYKGIVDSIISYQVINHEIIMTGSVLLSTIDHVTNRAKNKMEDHNSIYSPNNFGELQYLAEKYDLLFAQLHGTKESYNKLVDIASEIDNQNYGYLKLS